MDVIGLSGLITPSLDEMVDVAKELSKGGFKQPLLIGGATTSKMHTAVKIAPNYTTAQHPVMHVLDASRSVTVVSSLLSENKAEFVEDLMEEYEEMREDYYAGLEERKFLTFEQAKKEKFVIDFDKSPPPITPNKLGISVIDSVKIADVVPYLDWVRNFHDIGKVEETNACCYRTHFSKHGNCEADTPIEDIRRFSTTKQSEKKPRSSSTMQRR